MYLSGGHGILRHAEADAVGGHSHDSGEELSEQSEFIREETASGSFYSVYVYHNMLVLISEVGTFKISLRRT